MDTYFLVVATTEVEEHHFGPYISLSDATEIFMEHLGTLLFTRTQIKQSYTAALVEQVLDGEEWHTLAVKLEEHRKL